MTIDDSKSSRAAQSFFPALAPGNFMAAANVWGSIRWLLLDSNNKSGRKFVERVQKRDGVARSEKRFQLHSVLLLAAFARLADELADGHSSRWFAALSGVHGQAIASFIERWNQHKSIDADWLPFLGIDAAAQHRHAQSRFKLSSRALSARDTAQACFSSRPRHRDE